MKSGRVEGLSPSILLFIFLMGAVEVDGRFIDTRRCTDVLSEFLTLTDKLNLVCVTRKVSVGGEGGGLERSDRKTRAGRSEGMIANHGASFGLASLVLQLTPLPMLTLLVPSCSPFSRRWRARLLRFRLGKDGVCDPSTQKQALLEQTLPSSLQPRCRTLQGKGGEDRRGEDRSVKSSTPPTHNLRTSIRRFAPRPHRSPSSSPPPFSQPSPPTAPLSSRR